MLLQQLAYYSTTLVMLTPYTLHPHLPTFPSTYHNLWRSNLLWWWGWRCLIAGHRTILFVLAFSILLLLFFLPCTSVATF